MFHALLTLADYPGLVRRTGRPAARGVLMGIGITCFIDKAGTGPSANLARRGGLHGGWESAIDAGHFTVRGTDRSVTFARIADLAYHGALLPPNGSFTPGLEVTEFYDPPDTNDPQAMHLAVVIVDRETGAVTLRNLYAADDCGVVINPMIVEGQALMEHVRYDPQSGQLLSGSFMDYAMPRAGDLPSFALTFLATPAPSNPLGAVAPRCPRHFASHQCANRLAGFERFMMASVTEFEDHCWKDVIPPEDEKLYAGYARETFVGPSPALLAIDLYNLVYRGGPRSPYELETDYPNSCGIYAHQAIEPTRRLFAAARRAGLPIFYCAQMTTPNNRPPGAVSTRSQNVRAVREEDYDIYHAFTPLPADVVIRKQRASVFNGTPLMSHLTMLGVRSLIVCGESTSGCVRASSVDAYSNGFHVSLVEECVFDRALLTHKVNLWDLHHKYVDVMHLPEVVAHLDALAPNR